MEKCMNVIAIDPGTTESAILAWDGQRISEYAMLPNYAILSKLVEELPAKLGQEESTLAIEMIASYGMPVGAEVFETVLWIGRFDQAWHMRMGKRPRLVTRRLIKLHHCGSMRAKDSNIRQSLIDKYGPPGSKKAKGLVYGLKGDLWSAFAVATYITETKTQNERKV